MTEERKGLQRERGTVRPRTGRISRRAEEDTGRRETVDDGWDRDDREAEAQEERPARRRRTSGPQGRPPLTDEFADLNRGGAFAATESLAAAMDIFSRVLRGAVDRAFDEDYSQPGDVLRGITNEADLAVYDLVDEVRRVPRRLDRRFEDGIRSPRADRGERARRSDDDRGRR